MFRSTSTMADAESLEFAADIAAEAEKRLGQKIDKIGLSLDVRPHTPSSDTTWCVLVGWTDRNGAYQHEVAARSEIHDAANACLEKIPQQPDLAAILGYEEAR